MSRVKNIVRVWRRTITLLESDADVHSSDRITVTVDEIHRIIDSISNDVADFKFGRRDHIVTTTNTIEYQNIF